MSYVRLSISLAVLFAAFQVNCNPSKKNKTEGGISIPHVPKPGQRNREQFTANVIIHPNETSFESESRKLPKSGCVCHCISAQPPSFGNSFPLSANTEKCSDNKELETSSAACRCQCCGGKGKSEMMLSEGKTTKHASKSSPKSTTAKPKTTKKPTTKAKTTKKTTTKRKTTTTTAED